MTSGATSCITLTPKFPNPPLIPRALPCLAFGKKKLILPMLEAKFAPAKPHSKAITINIPKEYSILHGNSEPDARNNQDCSTKPSIGVHRI